MKKRFLPYLSMWILAVMFVSFSATGNAQIKVTGTAIGTAGSYGDNPATTFTAALDGDITTYFDAKVSSSFVGYDLGEGKSVLLTSIRYVPRSTHPQRMVGGQIWGSNTSASFSNSNEYDVLYTITDQPAVGVYTEAVISATESYRYICYHDNSSCNVAEVEFYGSVSTAIGDIETSDVITTGGTGMVKVQNAEQGSTVIIYDLTGKIIAKNLVVSSTETFAVPSGLCIVKVVGSQMSTNKVLVK
ncbi:DUF6383 domain-containing protein [Plebeiibacterium sediminum]|uniref:DUF6383 domain-containing protein n=1 Tax=Plebeiibacterium sediminum TaxID=2992112 RepID=A0AAE3SFN7_9BACT|nr:DUF6383 domain-containing protein [Plebeiobacterium sediminum]MCW3787665.1 DUF6383 domain-containing protein [Plebeiobacterium sediminum]